MTISPPRTNPSRTAPDASELLIKEARAASRRRRFRNVAVVFVTLLTAATLVSTIVYFSRPKPLIGAGTANPVGTASVPTCLLSQLSVTSSDAVGAGGTDGGVLLFRNVSQHACSLSGYPNVVAIGPSKKSITASHSSNDMLGGWDWTGTTPAPKPPTVILANKNAVASDWYQYGENGPAGYTLFIAHTLSVGLSGSRATVRVRGSVDAAEGKMLVTPFVPGKTGTAEPRSTH